MPSITTWTRVEPGSRSADLTAGLEARVLDPLWLLTRQWQVGEFQARNTGSPVTTSVAWSAASFDRFSVGGQPEAFDRLKPIEVQIEQEAVRPTSALNDYRQAAEAGLYFARLLNANNVAGVAPLFVAQYPLKATAGDAQTISAAMAGRVIDGIQLHAAVVAAPGSLPALPAIPSPQQAAVLQATKDWLSWYNSLFSEPAQVVGWNADQMEYTFALAAAGGTGSYVAREYDGGTADWYTLNQSAMPLATDTAQPTQGSKTGVIATPVSFRGMPARRFWEMEDASTDVAQIAAAAEDLGRMLLREFALVYAGDWFQFPLSLDVGSEVTITSLVVVDTFGVSTQIPHYSAIDGPQGGWRLFASTVDAPAAPANALLLTPGAVAPRDGAAIEEVLLLRDELARMVWGIERTVLGASGKPIDRTTAWNTALPIVSPPAVGGPPHYRLGSNVPDYWIPFIPVKTPPTPNGSSTLSLRRGKMPTPSSGAEGQMLQDTDAAFRLEEVPREGVLLQRRYRLARGLDGASYLWLARQRSIGKGEGQSGLHFDYLEP
jgi:predicted DCC family thiol-disulfide oxidoreductase YuxK